MATWAKVGPVLSGKTEVVKEIVARFVEQKSAYEESRKRAGITMERVYLMSTPMEEFVIAYGEGKGFEAAGKAFVKSAFPIDQWFLQTLKEVHGIDLSGAPPMIDQILSYVDETPDRKRGMAFCAPLPKGKLEPLKALFAEADGPRRSEMQQSRRQKGITRDCAYLNRTPVGDVVAIYLEGDDPAGGNKQFTASSTPFDKWFKDGVAEVFGIDFNQPAPPVTTLLDWQVGKGFAV
jgi:hypothetical protein